MTVDLTVHFGNSNWFNISIVDRIKFSTLYEMISFITNTPNTEILYMICNGHIVGGSGSEYYGFGNIIQDVPDLDIQDNKITVHIVTRNRKVKDDKYDMIIANRLYRHLKRPTITARTSRSDETGGVGGTTVISRTSAAPPSLSQMLGGGSEDLATLFTAMLNGGDTGGIMSYDQAVNLQNVQVILSDETFNRLTTLVDRAALEADDLSAHCFCGSGLASTNADADDTLTQLPCGHHFHTECIKHYLTTINTRCPVCNGDVRGE